MRSPSAEGALKRCASRVLKPADRSGPAPRRGAALAAALLLAAGLILLQVFIGGRGLLFFLPGLGLIGIAGLVGVATFSQPKTRADWVCLAGTGIFFAWLITRALFSPDYFARPDLFSAVGALLVYGLTVTALASSATRSLILGCLLATALGHVLVGTIQFTRGDDFMPIGFLQRGGEYGARASGFYVCPNHLAGLLEVVGIFGLSLTVWSRWPIWAKLLVGYVTVVCYAGVALTGSRGGYLSVMASWAVFGLLSLVYLRRTRPGSWAKMGLGGVLALGVVVAVAMLLFQQSNLLSERAGNIIDTKNMRLGLWSAALQQWALQPVVGTGSGTYRFYGREFRERQMQNDPIDVHNDYLHLLSEYGIVGALGFLLFFSAHLRHGWRSLQRLATRSAGGAGLPSSDRVAFHLAALAAIAAYVVHSVVDFNLHIPANAMLLAFVFGIVANPGISESSNGTRQAPLPLMRGAMGALAIILLIQCARLLPGEYFAERARVALRDEDPAAAALLARKALRYEDRNPELFFYLGRALIAQSRGAPPSEQAAFMEAAITAFKQAHSIAPLDGSYPLELAFTYDEVGRFDSAEQMYEVARRRDPHSKAVAQLYQAHLEAKGQ